MADALAKAGVVVEKSEIRLPQNTLRTVGDYEVTIELDGDVTAAIKLSIVAAA